MTPSPDTALAQDFLARLYANTETGVVNLFGVCHSTGRRQTAWAPVDDLAALTPAIQSMGGTGDLWVGVAARREVLDHGQRGKASDCQSISALWLDVDIAGTGHKASNLPLDLAEAAELVRRFQLPPDIVVHSGYGIQCYWQLSEDLEATEAQPLLTKWAATWLSIAKEKRCHLDSVWNIDRIMRLPGTYNWKGPEPVPVTMRVEPGSYHLSDIEDLLIEPPEPEVRGTKAYSGHLPGTHFNEVVKCWRILAAQGWTHVKTDQFTNDQHWKRPGTTQDRSATIYADDGHCAVWSDTVAATTGLKTRWPYDPFGLWTWLVHAGNFQASHHQLDTEGIPADLLDPTDRPDRHLLVSTLAKTPEKLVDWLWPSWLPAGKLVSCDGDPDLGKSTMLLDLTARITTGRGMPDGSGGLRPANVLLLAGEDDAEDTIRPRLRAAAADLDRVHLVEAVTKAGQESPVSIPTDLDLLAELIERTHARLAIIDVLTEYLDGTVDSHSDHAIRRALHRVRRVASQGSCAVIMVRHLRKESASKAIYRGGGSIAIVGAARAGWLVGIHPTEEATRVLLPLKMNLAPKPDPLGFQLQQHPTIPVAQVVWTGPVHITAEDLANGPLPRSATKEQEERQEERQSKVALCMTVLRQILAEGERWSEEVAAELEPWHFNRNTIDAARARIPVKARQARKIDGEVRSGWKMRLPD